MDTFTVPNWLYSEREQTRIMISMLESGGLKTAADYGDGFEDCSESDLARAKETLLQFDYIIKIFEGLARSEGPAPTVSST